MSDQMAATLTEAMRIRAGMRAEGTSAAECDRYVEGVLRQAWPFIREWHYICEDCLDLGWRIRQRETPRGELADYAERCVCRAGMALREKSADSDEALTKIGRTAKPTQIGRW